MSDYLIDSDVLIWHLRGQPDVIALLANLAETGDLGISAVSVLEVQAGARPAEQGRTNTFLEGFTCFAVDREIANQAGVYIRTYRGKGATLDFADSLVAATAVVHNLTLVTRNTSHYPMPEVQVLKG